MQSVILAGGFGSRLRPLIKDVPKPMAPVSGRCFLEYLLDVMKKNGIFDYTLCIHYMAKKIMDYFGDGSRFGVKIHYSIEEAPLGTGGAIGLLRDSVHETFCVINGDTYLELDMKEFIGQHHANGAIVSMATTEISDISRYTQVITDSAGNLTQLNEKLSADKKSGSINAGLYILEPEIFEHISQNRPVPFEKEVLKGLLDKNIQISTYPHVRNFFDIGIPDDYNSFQCWIAGGKKPG